jgi:hypothetical protein
MKHRPDQGAEPSWLTDKQQGKEQERPRVSEKSPPPSTFEPGTAQWWQEREDRPGDFRPDPDKMRPL